MYLFLPCYCSGKAMLLPMVCFRAGVINWGYVERGQGIRASGWGWSTATLRRPWSRACEGRGQWLPSVRHTGTAQLAGSGGGEGSLHVDAAIHYPVLPLHASPPLLRVWLLPSSLTSPLLLQKCMEKWYTP